MAEPLKNGFGGAYVDLVARAAADAHPDFDAAAFTAAVTAQLESLELKDRINLIADEVRAQLPAVWAEAVPAVIAIAESLAGPDLLDDAAWGSGMEAWPMCSVVERHGVDHPTESLAAMEHLTKAFSCEFAIRPFLTHHLDQTLAACRQWTGHEHPAVRRLPSEGTRPYLPWGPKVDALSADPELGIALISALRHDPDDVVRRSVANHLNDIARDHPDRVAAIATAWLAEPATDTSMIRHALRGLVKKGHPGAMAALGFTTTADDITVETFRVEPAEIRLGDSIDMNAALRSTSDQHQKLVVDFVIHHVGATGKTSPKVFKWTTIDLGPGETVTLEKRRRIQTASTRRYHAGIHRVELQIAGDVVAADAFDLLESS